MSSLPFPDTGTRMVEYQSGKPAINAVGYLYADEDSDTVAEAYYDSNGARGAAIAPDADGRTAISLDGYGRQPNYWGPADGTRRLWIQINGVRSPVDADYKAQIEDLNTTLTGVATVAATAAQSDDSRLTAAGLLVSRQDGASSLDKIQAAVNAAASTGSWVLVDGNHAVSGTITVPSGTRIDMSRGSITQTATRTPIFRLADATGVRFRNVRLAGVGSDYVNNSSVYGAAGIWLDGVTSDVVVDGGSILNFAGACVRVSTGVTAFHLRNLRMSGPGSPPITAVSNNYGGCVTVFDGPTDWSVIGCEMSDHAQGIVTGTISRFRIADNHIHNIAGQHGMYLEPGTDFTIVGNLVTTTAVHGIKLQIPFTGSPDADLGVIVGNTVVRAGGHCIILTNVPAGPPRLRRIVVSDNVITGDGAGNGDGINANYLVNVQLSGNNIYNVRKGVNLSNSSGVYLHGNIIDACAEQGIVLDGVTLSKVSRNMITNPAATNGPSTEFGIHVQSAGVSSLTIEDNAVTDNAANMRYGLYMVAGIDQATCTVRRNVFTGATDYGARLDSTQGIGEWAGNVCAGGLGPITGFPSTLVVKGSPSQSTGVSLPTSGAFDRGDIVWNRTPAPGGILGWVCTTAGSPGTWSAFGKTLSSTWNGPTANNLAGATFDPVLANTNLAALTSGVLFLARVDLPAGGVISTVRLLVGGAGSNLSGGNFIGVYQYAVAGSKLGETADQASAWSTTGEKSASLTAATAALDAATAVYVAFLCNGTTGPQLRGLAASAAFANVGSSTLPRFATAGSGLALLPSTLPTLTAAITPTWFGLS